MKYVAAYAMASLGGKDQPTMGMKYVAAYAMATLGGKDEPTAEDVKKILEAGGIAYDSEELAAVIARFEGKAVAELISAGLEKLETLGGGGGGGGGAAPAAGAAAAAEEKKEEVQEEEEEDMDFDLFG